VESSLLTEIEAGFLSKEVYKVHIRNSKKLDSFKDNIFATINDLAFIVSDVQTRCLKRGLWGFLVVIWTRYG
jgi:hypothetical protein